MRRVPILLSAISILFSACDDPFLTPEDSSDLAETLCSGGADIVVLLVDPNLSDGISTGVLQFSSDLCEDGYSVIQRISDFSFAADVRAYLRDKYDTSEGLLKGAILIGDLPYAYQYITFTSSPSGEGVSTQFYSDLDGAFEASPGYVSSSGHPDSYDLHTGDVDWEIWIGVLPMYRSDLLSSIDAINAYFDKNHAYRQGESHLPRRFLHVNEHRSETTMEGHNAAVQGMCCGTYAWTPFSDGPGALFYFESQAAGLTVDQGYEGLEDGLADFFVASSHGSWAMAGGINQAWVDGHHINTSFFWSGGCNVGNLDYPNNIITEILYGPNSKVVFAKGANYYSGGMGSNEEGFFGHNIATRLSQGESIGDAIVGHVNVPLLWPWSDSREFHTAVPVFFGDPTLRLRPFYPSCHTTVSGTVSMAGVGREGVQVSLSREGEGTLGTLSGTGGWYRFELPAEFGPLGWNVTAVLLGFGVQNKSVTVFPCAENVVDFTF